MATNKSRVIQASKGYILVDPKKCQGCMTCMLACSLVHEGKENLSLSRIQIIQNPFERFPLDIVVAQCRQCLSPACVDACPTGALDVDTDHGNIRTVHVERCNGCRECIEACSHKPHRIVWNWEEEHALTCDLCANTPFWNKQGGPEGIQACVAACPVGALKFTKEMPAQEGEAGYVVNLRGKVWDMMGYPTD
jgi:protein NrfC